MSSIVWVLMTFGAHEWAQPSLTFNTEDQCLTALADIKVRTSQEAKRTRRTIFFGGYCVPVESVR